MYVQVKVLQDICVSILSKEAVPHDDATVVADALIEANLRGYDSHGVIRLPLWVEGLRSGTINSKPRISVTSGGSAVALVNGDYGLGPVVGEYARRIAEERALKYGVGAVAIRRASHLSMLSYYADKMARRGLIGILVTNTEPAMAPFGGRDRVIGTNPICIAVPSSKDPIILDMSSSEVSRGKLLQAKAKREKIPETWALDKSGRPTDSPDAALEGTLRPIAGHKGSGLAIMVDLLAGALSGAAVATKVRGTYRMINKSTKGDLFIVINPQAFESSSGFLSLVQQCITDVTKSRPVAKDCKIYMPGQIDYERRQERLDSGLPLPEDVFDSLQELLSSARRMAPT